MCQQIDLKMHFCVYNLFGSLCCLSSCSGTEEFGKQVMQDAFRVFRHDMCLSSAAP